MSSQKQKPKIQNPKKDLKKQYIETKPGKRGYRLIWLGIILLLTIIIYSNSIKNDFINTYDDKEYIIDNNFIKSVSADAVKTIFTKYQVANYHPLTTLSWAIEYNLFGLNPKPYHIDNLILHLLNIILVFQLIFMLTKRNETSIIAALLFAVHPMHVESVTWLSERKDVLYAFFYLCSVISYILFISKNKKAGFYVLSLVFYLLSAFSKSAAITLPIVLLIIDYYYSRLNIKTAIEKAPFFAISIIFGVVAMIAQRSVGAVNQLYDFNLVDKVFMFFYSIWYYFASFFAPYNFAIIHYYPHKVNGLLPAIYYISPLLILALVLIISLKLKFVDMKFKKDLIFGLSFFLVGLLLIVQFIPLGPAIVSERYSYIPYIGLGLIIGQLYCKFADKKAVNSIFAFRFLLFAFVIFFSISTYSRNKVWKNSLTLFNDLANKYPDSDMGNYSAGYANVKFGMYEDAMKYFDKAISIDPKYTLAYVNRALCKHNMKDYQGEISDCSIAIQLNPSSQEAYNNRGTGRAMIKDYAGAIEDYSKSIKINPDYSTYLNRANAKLMLPDYKGAVEDYNICLKYNSQDAVTYYNKGIAEYNLNQRKEACDDWQHSSEMGYAGANEKLKQFCK